jgi:hypothetical protein
MGGVMRILVFLLILFMGPLPAFAQHKGPMAYRGMPYGHFCPGMGMGPYGVRRAIRTSEDARRAIANYFTSIGESIRPGKIEEKDLYFEVELLDKHDAVVDKAIVDKRTGRIRSIY